MKKEENQNHSRFFRGEGWYIALSEYAIDSEGLFKNIKSQILKPQFTVKDSGVTHRLINHWSGMGLIDDCSRTNEKGWRKLSVVDLIWIHMLMQLRGFGMSLDALKMAYQSTFHSHVTSKRKYPLFEFSILRCLQRNPVLVVVFEDGWCEYLFKGDYDFNIEMGFLNEKAYIVVNLNQCASSIFSKFDDPEYKTAIELSNAELDVIEKLRNGDLSELHLKLKDGQVQSLKKVYRENDNYQGLIDKIEHGECTVKRQNGKTVFTEVSEFQRINP